MFFDNTDYNIASNADDNTLYSSDLSLDKAIKKLEISMSNLFEWFQENRVRANTDKCHLLVTTKTPISVNIEETLLKIAMKKNF